MTKGWYQIVMAVLTTMILALLAFMGNWIRGVYAEHKGAVTAIQAHMLEEATQQQQQTETRILLKQIASDIGDIKLMTMTVMGLARTQNDGGDEASALVNVNGRAMMYKAEARVRVTNMESAEQQSVVVKVNGTFSMPNEDRLLLLSKRAGALLGLQPNQVVRIKLEPVAEEKK